MQPADWTNLGVATIGALLVIREVFSFILKLKKQDGPEKMANQIQHLYKQHQQTDGDGVPIWYVRRDLHDAVKNLEKTADRQTTILEGLAELTRDIHRDVKQRARERTTSTTP